MRPLRRSTGVAALTALAAILLAAPAQAATVKGHKLRSLAPVKLVKPFEGRKAKRARPLASAAAVFGYGGFAGALEPACCHVPEVGGAVSPTQVVQVDATSFTVFDRNGVQKAQTSIESFCGGGIREPRVLYDSMLKRWFVSALSLSGTPALCVAVSATSSATSSYYALPYPISTGGGPSRNLRMGMDADALFLAYDVHGTPTYAGTKILARSKAFLAAGKHQNSIVYSSDVSLTPPVVTDLEKPSSYFLATQPDGASLAVWAGTALHRVGGTLTSKGTTGVDPYADAVAGGDQPGTTTDILVGDSGFKTSSYQVGNDVMNAHTINRNGRPTTRWYVVQVDGPWPAPPVYAMWSGRLAESTTSDDFAPSVAASPGKLFLTWTSTNARAADASKRHGPRMRYATWEITEGSRTPVKTGLAAATGGVYTPTTAADRPWGRGQVVMAETGFGSCPAGTYAFAFGATAPTTNRWQGYVKKLGTC